jgi:peptidoglycan/xylan/chitin deacetylase (PgdA/CDA1 family)
MAARHPKRKKSVARSRAVYGTLEGGREVLLTFDDGPHPTLTPRLLDCLAERGAKGVFFVIGERVATKAGKAIVQRAFNEGHRIGNHTYTHPDLSKQTEAQVRDEIRRTEDLIAGLLTDHKLFRPPYGAHNPTVDLVVRDMGYHMVFWNVDTEDWRKKPDGWIEPSLASIGSRGYSTLLCHDIHATTVDNFPLFLDKVAAIPKVRFVTYA